MSTITCFKAYDVRGKVPDELNDVVAWRIGRAYAESLKPKTVAVGYDIRHTSPQLCEALADGLRAGGVDVLNIGLCGTEEIYHATAHFRLDGGIMVTASHNPIEYNGLKFVREGAKPISGDTGLHEIQALAEKNQFTEVGRPGSLSTLDARPAYIKQLMTYVDISNLKPLQIVVNPGNGGAGIVVDELEKHLPFEFIKINYKPDGSFPNGIPNPLLVERRNATINAIREHKADLGISWDGDFDRCFFFDETGCYIEGYYIVGLLAQAFLQKSQGAKIIYDPRLTWNTIDVVKQAGGVPIQSKAGHAFMKERLRKEDAIYGGEMSAHHYFRDFAYSDSGMIPWLLITELLSVSGQHLSDLVNERMAAYPCSGEINFEVGNPKQCIDNIRSRYANEAINIDFTDGVSMEFSNWRFNLRTSNTEPLLRLNLESRSDKTTMQMRTNEISEILVRG